MKKEKKNKKEKFKLGYYDQFSLKDITFINYNRLFKHPFNHYSNLFSNFTLSSSFLSINYFIMYFK